ncbi:hypothetical protein AB99_3334, partial [Escherichia coli 1-182-04_S3_C1]
MRVYPGSTEFVPSLTHSEGCTMALTDAKIRAAKPTDKAYKLTD